MENLFNSIKSAALSVGEKFVPILKESKFKETGVLTPEEFIIAGDYLTHHFPTWSWSKAVNSSYEKDYMTQAAGLVLKPLNIKNLSLDRMRSNF